MNELPKLSPRLIRAASMVRQGSFVADVGTDHAYLPIYLFLEGRIRGGVASDVNAGPVERGRKNIESFGLEKSISVVHTDGLSGIERFSPDDVLILGMGGELIARILGDAEWTRDSGIRLCLQPMTHPEILRAFLLDNGYSIVDEQLVAEGDRIYQLIAAQYSGASESYSSAELLLGRINASRRTEEFFRLAELTVQTLTKRAHGKKSAGIDPAEERQLLGEIQKLISEDKK